MSKAANKATFHVRTHSGALTNLLTHAMAATETKGTMPELCHAKLTASIEPDGHKLRADGYDMEVAVSATTECEIIKSGVAIVPAKDLRTAVAKLDEPITLKCDGKRLDVTGATFSMRFPVLSVEGYPALPETGKETWKPIDAKSVSRLFANVKHAVAAEGAAMRATTGTFLHHRNGLLECIALTGAQLARSGLAMEFDPLRGMTALVPAKAVAAIMALLGGVGDGTCDIALSENTISVRTARASVIARLLAEKFPDTEQVIPADVGGGTIVLADALSKQLSRSMGVAGNSIALGFTHDEIHILGRDTDGHESYSRIGCSGGPVDMHVTTVNAGQFIDALANMGTSVRIQFADEYSPLIVRPVDDANEFRMTMPMNPEFRVNGLTDAIAAFEGA